MSSRKLAVNGQFYPDDKQELEKYINHFNNVLDENNISIEQNLDTRAIIVPHAGYIYSGFTANIAYKYIPKDIKNIIVIGPSHKFAFQGASVAMYNKYPTPFGDLEINTQLSDELINKYDFLGFNDEVHCEHSTETQFPFIKYYTKDIKVVEIVYSQCDYENISQTINYLIRDKNNFIVISTDLSHFYTQTEAQRKDNICLKSILQKDINSLESGCEACGMIGIKAMLSSSNFLNLQTKLLDYRTSADVTKDEKSVVGYSSFMLYKVKNNL